MAVESFDFDDLPEEEVEKREKNVTISIKAPKDVRDMLSKIAHRERHNMSEMGAIILEDYINNYVDKYKKQKA